MFGWECLHWNFEEPLDAAYIKLLEGDFCSSIYIILYIVFIYEYRKKTENQWTWTCFMLKFPCSCLGQSLLDVECEKDLVNCNSMSFSPRVQMVYMAQLPLAVIGHFWPLIHKLQLLAYLILTMLRFQWFFIVIVDR